MNFADIKSAIYDCLDAYLNGVSPVATIYWGEPNAPRPANPSVRLKLIGGPGMLGQDELRDVDGDPDAFLVTGPRELTLSVTTYGDTALQMISDLQTMLGMYEHVETTLSVANVSVLETTAPRDLSTALDTEQEQRAQFDVMLLATEEVSSEPGVIEDVEAESSIGGNQGQISVP